MNIEELKKEISEILLRNVDEEFNEHNYMNRIPQSNRILLARLIKDVMGVSKVYWSNHSASLDKFGKQIIPNKRNTVEEIFEWKPDTDTLASDYAFYMYGVSNVRKEDGSYEMFIHGQLRNHAGLLDYKSDTFLSCAEGFCDYTEPQINMETFNYYETVTIRMPVNDKRDEGRDSGRFPTDMIICDAKMQDPNFPYDNVRDFYHALLDEVLDNKENYKK